MPSINKTLIILVRNILSSIMSILIHILSFHIKSTLTSARKHFFSSKFSELFWREIFIIVKGVVAVTIVRRLAQVEIVRAGLVGVIFHQEVRLTRLGPVVRGCELVVLRLQQILTVLRVRKLQLWCFYLVTCRRILEIINIRVKIYFKNSSLQRP